MTPGQWRRVREVFDEAADLPSEERPAFVAAACGDDADLRGEVEALLACSAPTIEGFQAAVAGEAAGVIGGLAPGRRLGAYRLLSQLGAGGMGTVYLAERVDQQYRTQVALKILTYGMKSPHAVARFRDERQILAALEHPGIVRLLDGGTEDDLPYLVMERIDGIPLTRYAREHALSVRARVELFRKVCDAIQYAHQKLVIHRDIKPSNILVEPDATPRLLDFGIARMMDDTAAREARTGTGMALFTPGYASPEQVRGQPISSAADIYSMGAVLYELLADAPAHRLPEGDAVAALRVICEVDPARPSEVAPRDRRAGLVGDLDTIVLKALQKDPARRYASVEQLSEDLRRHLVDLPIAARPNTWSYRAGKFLGRNRAVVTIAGAALAVLIAGAIISVARIVSERNVARRERAGADAARRLVEDRNHELVVMQSRSSLERDPTAAAAWIKQYPPGASGEELARAIVADAGSRGVARHALRAHGRPVTDMGWSPDGAYIASASDDGIRLSDARTGEVRALAGDERITRLVFSPDGRFLASGGFQAGVRLWDWRAGAQRLLSGTTAESPVLALAYSPDGALVAAGDVAGVVRVWDVGTGALRELGRHGGEVRALAFSPDGRALASGGYDGVMRVWDPSGAGVRVLDARAGPISGFAWLPDGRALLAGGGDGAARLWEVDTGVARSLGGHEGDVWVAVSPVGVLVATAGVDGKVLVHDVRGEATARSLAGHQGAASRVEFSPDGRALATAGADHTVRLWDVESGEARLLRGHAAAVTTLAWAPAGDLLATGGFDGALRVWSTVAPDERRSRGLERVAFSPDGVSYAAINGGELEVRLAGAAPRRLGAGAGLTVLAWSRDGGQLAVASPSGPVRLFDVRTGAEQALTPASGEIGALSFSADGVWLAGAGYDGLLPVWNTHDGTRRVFPGHASYTLAVAFAPTGLRLASGGADVSVRLWDLVDGSSRAFDAGGGPVHRLAWSPDGARLASGDANGAVIVWDSTTGARLGQERHSGFVNELAWSADGAWLGSASSDKTVMVWRTPGGARALAGHDQPVVRVAWSPAGRVASASLDGTVRVWEPTTGSARILRGHGAAVRALSFAAGLVSAGDDRVVRWWAAEPAAPLPDGPAALRDWLDALTTARIGPDGQL